MEMKNKEHYKFHFYGLLMLLRSWLNFAGQSSISLLKHCDGKLPCLFHQLLQHHVVQIKDLFQLLEPCRMFWTVQGLFYFRSWGDPAILQSHEV
jgi:hypothetical protein